MKAVMVQDGVRANLTRPLTRRQHECVELVTEGLSSKEIARKLGIAPSTVDNHIAQVMHQLGIPNRAALRKYNLVGRTLVIVEDAPVVEPKKQMEIRKRSRVIREEIFLHGRISSGYETVF
jgi:DNA-binding CsgD family transcriptional regulator